MPRAYRICSALVALFLAPALAAQTARAEAEDCPELGLNSAYLSAYFCDALQGIAEEEVTRTLLGPPDPQTGPGDELPPDLRGIDDPLILQAWRVDPKKTLELIQRIRTAGGLPES